MDRRCLRSFIVALLTVGLTAVAVPAGAQAAACSSGHVALTFDDGPDPSPENTSLVLDHLQAKQVKATFFFLGRQVASNRALSRRTVAEGHRVQNHTYTHPELTTLSPTAIRSEFTRTNDAFAAAGLPRPDLQRPPYGATNDTVEQIGEGLGLTQVVWNVDPRDWENPTAGTIRARVREQVRPNSIMVILLHDAWTQNTAAAVPGIIDDLRADGYCFAFIQPGTEMVPGVGRIELVPTDGVTNPPPSEDPPPIVITPQDPAANVVTSTRTGASYAVSGTNEFRDTDELVVYTPAAGASTPTNRWGAEAAVVDGRITTMLDRAASDAPPLAIPGDGIVISGHGRARDWMLANLQVGTTITLPGAAAPPSDPEPAPEPDPEPAPEPDPEPAPEPEPPPATSDTVVTSSGASYRVSGTDVFRNTDQLVIYTPAAGSVTPTNRWGAEAAVVGGEVIAIVDRVSGEVPPMAIPRDGIVISGHGVARRWMLANVEVGTTITVPG